MKKIINNGNKNWAQIILQYSTVIIFALVLAVTLLSIRGDKGTPVFYQHELDKRMGGPFEATNSTARYALTKSIVEDKSFFISEELAEFSDPDVAYFNNKFLILFLPGVSFIGVPFYMIGSLFDAPQLFTYFSVTLFALINVFLVAKLAMIWGSSRWIGIMSGLIFYIGTNAFSYAQSYTQHHMSTTLILLALINANAKRTWINNILFGLIAGGSLLFDIPNLLMILPIGLYVVFKHFNVSKEENKLSISLKLKVIALIIGIIPMFGLQLYYNYATSGSITKFAQSIGRTTYFNPEAQKAEAEAKKNPPAEEPRGKKLDLDTRLQLNGMYTLLLSDERSWIYYSPIVLLGIFGFYIAYKNNENRSLISVATGVVLMDILLYSMFADPWGGWSFGPRYLIPAAAILCGGIGPAISKYKTNIIFVGIFTLLLGYSVFINIAGANTTSLIPPKVEAVNAPEPMFYTYERNLQLMEENVSSSLIYNIYLQNMMTYKTYIFLVTTLALVSFMLIYMNIILKEDDKLTVEKT